MGYAPLFDTLTKGTLCGRWPDIGLWPIVLSLGDRYGVVDVTPTYIASVTGLPVEDVTACMKRFCEPDPYSRSTEENGARLVLLDEHRDWGWRIVNHGFYREKARKAAFDAERTADGSNAKRMKERTREDPPRPAKSDADPPSDSDSDSDSDKNLEREARAQRSPPSTRLPADFELTPERRAVAEAENANPDREFANFCDHWRSSAGAKARKLDWDATWRIWCRRAADFKPRINGSAAPEKPKLSWRPPADEEPIDVR